MADRTIGEWGSRYFWRFVSVVIRQQTYRNLVYLLLMLPLGTVYLIVITAGVSLAISLIPLLIGVPLLLAVLVVTTRLVTFERWLTRRLLSVEIPINHAEGESVLDTADNQFSVDADVWSDPWTTLTDRSTWVDNLISPREVVYLGSKHVIGAVTWLVLTISLATGLLFLFGPLHYQYPAVGIHVPTNIRFVPEFIYQHDAWQIDYALPFVVEITRGELFANSIGSVGTSLVSVLIGLFVTLVALHIINGTARLYARFAELMLRS